MDSFVPALGALFPSELWATVAFLTEGNICLTLRGDYGHLVRHFTSPDQKGLAIFRMW